MIIPLRYGTQQAIRFAMVKRAVVDLAATGDWTPATGDTKISKDGGNVANTNNNPSAVGGTGSVLWTLTLTAAETQASEVVIQIVDSATKAVEDQVLICRTLPAPVYDALYGGTYKVFLVDAPQVVSVATQKFDSDATSHSVTMPTCNVRDLLIVIFANDGNATVTTPTGWNNTATDANGTAARLSIFTHICDGSEGSPVDFVTSATEQASSILIRIRAGTYNPGYAGSIQVASAATGTSTTPDVPSMTPLWQGQNTLLIAVYGADDQAQATAYPADFQDGATIQGANATGASVGAAFNVSGSGGSPDPGTFTIASQEWIANLIAIRPARPRDSQNDTMGYVVSNGSNTASTFQTSRTEASNDWWLGAYLRFVTGNLAGQVRRISAYNGTTKFVTLADALTAAPTAGDLFDIVNE